MSERPGGEGLQLGPIRVPDFLRPQYANYVNVNHTPWDFRMTFAVVKVPMPGPEVQAAERQGVLEAEAIADVLLPANLMHGLIMALQDNYDRYLTTYGVPGMDPRGPGHQDEE
jgi:Protein of unknown function (DUF3467)